MTADELKQRVQEFDWYHTIDLGQGVVTPGQYDLRPILRHYGIPESLRDKSVLDVGPGHGFFSLEFERRGASRVATVELPAWSSHDASPLLRKVFEKPGQDNAMTPYLFGAIGLAIEARGSKVERLFHNVYDISPEKIGKWDVVFCASVLLHLTDPLRALYAIQTVTTEQAIICTGIDTTVDPANQARALFLGTATGQAFWIPTITCLEKMVLAAGFSRVERVATFHLKSTDGKFDTPHGTVRGWV
ncbi:MAG: methyltransferase domain-containing protein [Acidobacteria bacterium]|nr:methyltransferase domain-containing protein [Acidobacteriota bacterium]